MPTVTRLAVLLPLLLMPPLVLVIALVFSLFDRGLANRYLRMYAGAIQERIL